MKRARVIGRGRCEGISVVELLLAIAAFSVFLAGQTALTRSRVNTDYSDQLLRQYKAIGAAVAAGANLMGTAGGSTWTPVTAAQLFARGAIPAERLGVGQANFAVDVNGNTPSVYVDGDGHVLVVAGPAPVQRIASGVGRGQVFLIYPAGSSQCAGSSAACAVGLGAAGVSALPSDLSYSAPAGQAWYAWHG